MSRLTKKPIKIPEDVDFKEDENRIVAKGAKGEVVAPILPGVSIKREGDLINVSKIGSGSQAKSNAGTTYSLIKNAIEGAEKGFSKTLEIEGVGYKMALEGKTLVLNVGFSHPVRFDIPDGIEANVDRNSLTISGPSKELIGKVSAEIRLIKKPEPYHGTGIRYKDEQIRRKVGKKAATASE